MNHLRDTLWKRFGHLPAETTTELPTSMCQRFREVISRRPAGELTTDIIDLFFQLPEMATADGDVERLFKELHGEDGNA